MKNTNNAMQFSLDDHDLVLDSRSARKTRKSLKRQTHRSIRRGAAHDIQQGLDDVGGEMVWMFKEEEVAA